jgi:hypothetical protein
MSSQFAHEYVHSDSIGDAINCRETIKKTKENIKPLYDTQEISGYQLLLIENSIDVQEKLIDNKFEKLTKNQFPFVYALVQPLENSKSEFDGLMEGLHYVRVDV